MAEEQKVGVVLDEAAMSIFREIEGIDDTNRLKPLGEIKDDDSDLDAWRMLLLELVEAVGEQICLCRKEETSDEKRPKIDRTDHIVEKLKALSELHGTNRILTIRYRGMVISVDRQEAREFDYEASYEKLRVDLPIAKIMAKKKTFIEKELPQRLNQAFSRFAMLEINTLTIDLARWSEKSAPIFKASFKILPKFFASSNENAAVIVTNEKHKPDPNLTQLAVLNRLKKDTAQVLVKKVVAAKNANGPQSPLAQFYSIYDAIFAIKQFRQKFLKPSVEINNVQYLEILKSCFDEDGRFIRNAFEKNIPEFVKAEKNVFEFLWNDYKRIQFKQDRVAFLNSLQFVIAEMKLPHEAIKLLIEDFSANTRKIEFSDRSAIMLSNILLRTYNKELRIDIEITPEEVLQVRSGLNKDVIAFTSKLIDDDRQGNFVQKIVESHKKLQRWLRGAKAEKNPMPPGFLIALEREAYIFLSLIGGGSSHEIVRKAVEEYGNPDSEIYNLEKSQQLLRGLLPLLEVGVRGLVRFEDHEDLPLLEMIRSRSTMFKTLVQDDTYRDLVDRVMEWVDVAISDLQDKIEAGESSEEPMDTFEIE